jgi:hypothetical protein
MSSTTSSVMLPNRLSLAAVVLLLAQTVADVFAAAYNRADDIEPFGL